MYANTRIKNVMKRDHFLSILKFIRHFSDTTTARPEDRLNIIRNVLEAIVDTFKDAVKPGKILQSAKVWFHGEDGLVFTNIFH